MPTRPAKRTRRRAPPVAEVARRLAAIEARLTALETGKAGPGDGRAATERPRREAARCPGCGLILRRRAGRCAACGRPLDRR